MTTLKVYVKSIARGTNLDLTIIADNHRINRTVSKDKLDTKEKLAAWVLGQLDSSHASEDTSKRGIFTIEYHTEEPEPDTEVRVIDSVTKNNLPNIFNRDLVVITNRINSLDVADELKGLLKQITRALWFNGL